MANEHSRGTLGLKSFGIKSFLLKVIWLKAFVTWLILRQAKRLGLWYPSLIPFS